jgi:hypothetical protein
VSRATFASVAMVCGLSVFASCAQVAEALMPAAAAAAAGTAVALDCKKVRRVTRVRLSISLMDLISSSCRVALSLASARSTVAAVPL